MYSSVQKPHLLWIEVLLKEYAEFVEIFNNFDVKQEELNILISKLCNYCEKQPNNGFLETSEEHLSSHL